MYVALNKCYGGFSLSREAEIKYVEKKYGEAYCYHEINGTYYKITKEEYINSENLLSFFVVLKDLGDSVDENEEFDVFDSRDETLTYRSDPILIEVIRELGKKANGICAEIKLVDVPKELIESNGVVFEDCDGYETLHEIHREW